MTEMTRQNSGDGLDAARGLDEITKVLRVHSGDEFTADDFPTAEEGRAAWVEWQGIVRLLLTDAQFRARYEIAKQEAEASERHTVSFEEFDLRIAVMREGQVEVSFHAQGKCVLSMDFDTFRECIDCVGRFGLGMKSPMLVEEEVVKDGE